MRTYLGCLLLGFALLGDGLQLLTENGLRNATHSDSAYKEVPRPHTGGEYIALPAFGIKEEAGGRASFADGILTNGDASFDYKRRPLPYAYWQDIRYARLTFDLKRPYRIRNVRVCILNQGPHGTEDIELLAKGDPLEFPDALRLGRLEGENGWNTFSDLNRVADGVTLRFRLAKGKTYMTVSEVEIWGEPLPEGPQRQAVSASSTASRLPLQDKDGPWFAFDFGPPDAPVFAHFVPVSQEVVYDVDRGYGWIPQTEGEEGERSNFQKESDVVPGLGQRDRAAERGACGDSLYRDFAMTCAYYHSQARQTFAVALPNGTYRAVSFHGDQRYGRPGAQSWWIEAEGRRAVHHPQMPQSRMFTCTFDVTVDDGRLDLTFDSDAEDPARRGFILNGLALMPAGTVEQRQAADLRIARIHGAIERERDQLFRETFEENPYVESRQMRAPTEVEKERGFITFVPHWMDNVFPNSVPRPEDEERPLACFACPGEFEPMKVAVRALEDLEGLTFGIAALSGPGGSPIEVDIRVVRCWRQRLGSSWSTEWRVMPELLEPAELADPITVPAGTCRAFWLTAKVPEDCPPGVYSGQATLSAGRKPSANLPVQVEVLPFRLAPSDRVVGMYWQDGPARDDPALMQAQVADMLAHGISAVTLGQVMPEVSARDGGIVLDTAPLLSTLQSLKELGIAGPIPYHMSLLMRRVKGAFPESSDEELDALYVEAIRQLQHISARADTPQLLFYPVDEIGNSEERGRTANHECALIAKVPGAVSYITVNNFEAGQKWGEPFDIWCGNIVYTLEQEAELLGRGKRYMRYGSAYLNDPRKTRSSTGFGFYRRPAEAMYYWHYQYAVGDPFNDFDGNSRDWCVAYPGPDHTLIPTTDWEGIREGVDDLRYIATLKQTIDEMAETPGAEKKTEHGRAVLAEVLGEDEELRQTAFREDLSNDEYHALRRRLADAILHLKGIRQ